MTQKLISQRAKDSSTLVTIVIIVAIITILNLFSLGAPTLKERIIASIIIFLAIIPIFRNVKKIDPWLPFLPLFGIIYSLYYAAPVFLLEKWVVSYHGREKYLSHEALEKGLWVALLGLCCTYVSFYWYPGRWIKEHVPKIQFSLDLSTMRFAGISLGLIGMIFTIISRSINILLFQELLDLLASFLLVGIVILYTFYLDKHLDFIGKVILWGILIPFKLLSGLGTGHTFLVIDVFILLIFTFWTNRGYVPWIQMFILGGMLIILISLKGEFRRLAWYGEMAQAPYFRKAYLYVDMTLSYLRGEKGSFIDLLQISMRRLGFLTTLAYVVDVTPEVIPYWKGKTYLPLVYIFPRFIFPWKPQNYSIGQEFGHRYGLLQPHDFTTAYNTPQLIEMYANFGIWGVIIGMFLMGIIYRLILETFGHPKCGNITKIIGIVICTRMLYIEGNFALVYGNLIWWIIGWILVLKFFTIFTVQRNL